MTGRQLTAKEAPHAKVTLGKQLDLLSRSVRYAEFDTVLGDTELRRVWRSAIVNDIEVGGFINEKKSHLFTFGGKDTAKMITKRKGKKHVQAAKQTLDGYVFDSTLEYNFYVLAKARGLSVEVKPETVELLPSFEYGRTIKGSKHTVDGISYTYDFRIGNHIIETKGRLMKDASLRIRLYKWYLKNNFPDRFFWMPRNVADINAVLDLIEGKPRVKTKPKRKK